MEVCSMSSNEHQEILATLNTLIEQTKTAAQRPDLTIMVKEGAKLTEIANRIFQGIKCKSFDTL